jgi:hypothetical protein
VFGTLPIIDAALHVPPEERDWTSAVDQVLDTPNAVERMASSASFHQISQVMFKCFKCDRSI